MPDHFALLNETRRPWLDPDLLKQKFLGLSGRLHPDKIAGVDDSAKAFATKQFAELNMAYRCLADPKLRLLHLLELELGAKPKDIQQIPPGLADLFAEVAMVCRNTDSFLAEKEKVTSPLLQVQLFQKGQDWIEKLNSLQKKLNELSGPLATELKALDAKWIASESGPRREILTRLEEIYRLLGYFNRWNNQLQERIARISF